MAPLFGGVSSLEDCNLGTAKCNSALTAATPKQTLRILRRIMIRE